MPPRRPSKTQAPAKSAVRKPRAKRATAPETLPDHLPPTPGEIALEQLREKNPRWARFVEHLLVHDNALRAYAEAGFEGNAYSNRSSSSKLRHHPAVAPVLAALRAEIADESKVDAARVVEEWAVIGFSDVRHYRVGADGRLELAPGAPDEAMRAVASVDYETRTDDEGGTTHKVKFRLHPKNPALADIAKHLGMLKERVEHSGSVTLTRDEAEDRIMEILARAMARKKSA